jgi:hypothetical protein
MYPHADNTPVAAVTACAAKPTTRRGTPWQERSPYDLWPTATAVTAASSQGQHPAHTRHAISTREHQKGGAPTRCAPTRRGHPARSPPVRRKPWPIQPTGLKAKLPSRRGFAHRDPGGPGQPRPKPGRRATKKRTPQNKTNSTPHVLDSAVPHQIVVTLALGADRCDGGCGKTP